MKLRARFDAPRNSTIIRWSADRADGSFEGGTMHVPPYVGRNPEKVCAYVQRHLERSGFVKGHITFDAEASWRKGKR